MRAMPALLLACAAFSALSLCMGPHGFAPGIVAQALAGEETGRLILIELRLPRLLLGLLVGGTLGLAGATLQGLFRNPLAEPGVIGVSGCAALGAVIAFYTGVSTMLPLGLPLGGVAGALIAIMVLLALASRDPRISTLLLAGVALSALASALTALALNLSPNPYATVEVVFWLLGSLSDRSLEHVFLALPFILAGGALMLACGRGLEALTLGEDTARSLGISIGRLRRLAVIGVAFAVGASVAVTGAIGFVGLIVPHLLRPLVDHRPAPLLLISIPGGACLTLAADIAVRLIGGEVELRLGVATALIGAPFFLYLVLNLARRAP
ncbi:MAG: hmuU [Alphaproteobacteria bacterium]|nr:hmuU [Alphaproteobacteria bacterium]